MLRFVWHVSPRTSHAGEYRWQARNYNATRSPHVSSVLIYLTRPAVPQHRFPRGGNWSHTSKWAQTTYREFQVFFVNFLAAHLLGLPPPSGSAPPPDVPPAFPLQWSRFGPPVGSFGSSAKAADILWEVWKFEDMSGLFATGMSGKLPRLWPVSPWLLVALFPLLPTSFYLNRGFTIWYHWVAILYGLTALPFLRSVLILQGFSVSLGWYSAILVDYALHNTFFLTLYKNTPNAIRKFMFEDNGLRHPHTGQARTDLPVLRVAAMVVAHVVDALAHPGLGYCMWRLHCRANNQRGVSRSNSRRHHLASALTLPVIGFSFALCRIWSLVHTAYNQRVASLYYFGHDIYNLDHLDGWLPAYIAEAVAHGAALCFWAVLRCGQRQDPKLLSSVRSTGKNSAVSAW